jgi:hypothetical protein
MQQHLVIKQTMEKLAHLLAKCDLNPRSTAIQQIFARKLQEATACQSAMGGKATWKRVRYNDGATSETPRASGSPDAL